MSEPSRERLEWAAGVLNQRRHRFADRDAGDLWYVLDTFVYGPEQYDAMSGFEAVAIASAYEGEDAARRVVAAIEEARRSCNCACVFGLETAESLAIWDEALEVARKAAGITEGGSD